ncbi:MAG TPA: 5'-nucleotidase C-terminal domain-containing protein, partial [bacterium]|nr:5'-nucleotidase C-terminal domain-containing protein [bacterium]
QYEYTIKRGDRKEKKQIGGLDRLASVVQRIKDENPGSVLLLSAGDDLSGKYYRFLNGKAIYTAMDMIGYDVATLGNHEFDHGIKALTEAIGYATFPIVSSNMDFTGTSLFKLVRKYWIKEINGVRVGVIGLMTPYVRQLSRVEDPIRLRANIFACADEYAGWLRDVERVDIVIALTHIGIDLDRALVERVRGIDVICGGHSHTLLQSGAEIVQPHSDGTQTVVVATGSRGGFLGRLDLQISGKRIVSHRWETIIIDETVPPDPQVAAQLDAFRKQIPAKALIGELACDVVATREAVRSGEANVGNLIADAMRERFNADIALINSGGIRAETVYPKGPVYTETILEWFPFENDVVLLQLTGREIRDVLELGVCEYEKRHGRFLQVSGMKYSFDPSAQRAELDIDGYGVAVGFAQRGARVKEISLKGSDGTWRPLEDDRTYTVAVGSYMAGGGDSYFMLKGKQGLQTFLTVQIVLEDYIKEMKTVDPRCEGRITVIGSSAKRREPLEAAH